MYVCMYVCMYVRTYVYGYVCHIFVKVKLADASSLAVCVCSATFRSDMLRAIETQCINDLSLYCSVSVYKFSRVETGTAGGEDG